MKQLKGLDAIKEAWELYEPNNKKLTEILSPTDWKTIKDGSLMRNLMIHGVEVFALNKCENKTNEILAALDNIKSQLDLIYNYSGWTPHKKRIRNRLHFDPKVRIT